MEERILITLVVVMGLIGPPTLGAEEPEQPNVISVIALDPNDEEAARELITWEMVKLGVGGASLPLQVPPGSKLEKTLRQKLKEADPDSLKKADAPLTLSDLKKILADDKLELTDSHTLLGFLRLQASGKKLDDPEVKDALKDSALAEIAKIVDQRPNEKVKVLPSLEKALSQGLKKALEKAEEPVPSEKELIQRLQDPKDLLRALKETDSAPLDLEDLSELAGSARAQGRKIRGSQFAEDVREEARDLLDALRRSRPKDPGDKRPSPPFPVVKNPPAFNPGQATTPPPLVQRNGGFAGKSPFSGRHNGGGQAPAQGSRGAGSPGTGTVALSGPPPVDTALTPTQEARLDRQKDKGHISLQMRTAYANSPGVVSACQITAVNRPTPIPNSDNLCEYDLATARHCVEKDGQAFSNIAIQGLDNLTVTRAQVDNLGNGDLAMLAVEATCRDIPFAPLALSSPRGEDGILVYASIPLKGQAETNAISSNLMMMNTNHPDNGGVNVVQGNSGGAVTNERGELVGVISSVMMAGRGPNAKQVPGIGFFATRDSLEFANAFVNPNFKPQVLGAGGRLPDLSLSQASAQEHSN